MNSQKTSTITSSLISLILDDKEFNFLPQLSYENDFEGFRSSILDNFK